MYWATENFQDLHNALTWGSLVRTPRALSMDGLTGETGKVEHIWTTRIRIPCNANPKNSMWWKRA